jgi:hypothetical protein
VGPRVAAIAKRLRYEVLRRDGHTCYYCGAKAPEVKLVVDAVVPEALGGSHKDPANLRAACEPCNSGKTSSSPDAPLVAAVAADAARWARAMAVAQQAMLAEIDARKADQEQFRQWWDSWGYGDGDSRTLIPKDPNWRQSVDQLVAAGLPLAILKNCIEIAMSRQSIRPEATFRYMCGVAWKKLTELQEAARGIASDGAAAETANRGDASKAPPYAELVRYLLDMFPPSALEHAAESVKEDEDQPAPGDMERAILEHAIITATTDLQWVQSEVIILLDRLPGTIGARAQQHARQSLHEERGAAFTKTDFIDRALTRALDLLDPEWAPF